jgi:hypothetical protein
MNSSASGDIVTVLDADIQPFKIGLQQAGKEAQAFGGKMSGDLGRAMGQMGFAAQDFASVMAMGGKNSLGRAMMSTMNNVQMLGQAFGPWGMAITAVGGALGSILIPKLLETTEVTSKLGETFKAAAKDAAEAGKMFEDAVKARQKIEKIEKPEQGQAMLDTLQTQDKILEDKLQRLKQLKTAASQTISGIDARLQEREFSPGKLPGSAEQEKADRQAAVEERNRLQKEIEETERERAIGKRQAEDVRGKMGEAAAAEDWNRFFKRFKEQDTQKMRAQMEREKQEDAAADKLEEKKLKTQEQIARDSESRFDTTKRKMNELNLALDQGLIGPDLHAKAAAKLIEDFGKGEKKDQKLAGAQAGSATAYEQIRDSIRDATKNPADDERIDLLKRQADAAEQAAANTKKMAESPPLRVEGID